MVKRILLIAVAVCFFAVPSVMAQDAFHLEGTADGEFPVTLAPETAYTFAFDVFNDAGGDEAIKYVAITLPTTAYTMGTYAEETDGFNDGYTWFASYDVDSAAISWEAVGTPSSVETGDIGEGEMLTFAFMATTDVDATDGFDWLLTGDAGTAVAGSLTFGEETDDDTTVDDDATDDDDDDVVPDDDDDTAGDDDDDDDDGGCGC